MAQRIDLAKLYRSALDQARDEEDDAGAPCPLPDVCPFALDELVVAGDLDGLTAVLAKTD